MGGFDEWWNDIPIVTKYLFGGSMFVTVAAGFGFFSPYSLLIIWPQVYRSFELWRLGTCFLYQGQLSLSFLMQMVFLYRYSMALERAHFTGFTAEYIWFITVSALLLLVTSYLFNFVMLGPALVMSIIYYWSRQNPTARMSFMFGIQFEGIYLPWVMIGFKMLMGGNPVMDVVGVIVGHFYYFFHDLYPLNTGRYWLRCPPSFFYYWPPYRPMQGVQPQGFWGGQRAPNWGQGHRLGG